MCSSQRLKFRCDTIINTQCGENMGVIHKHVSKTLFASFFFPLPLLQGCKLKNITLRFIIALALVQHCEGGGGVCAVQQKKKERKKSICGIYYIHKQWKTVDQEKLWHTCDTVMVLPTPWRQKRMGFYSIWLFTTTPSTPPPHTEEKRRKEKKKARQIIV